MTVSWTDTDAQLADALAKHPGLMQQALTSAQDAWKAVVEVYRYVCGSNLAGRDAIWQPVEAALRQNAAPVVQLRARLLAWAVLAELANVPNEDRAAVFDLNGQLGVTPASRTLCGARPALRAYLQSRDVEGARVEAAHRVQAEAARQRAPSDLLARLRVICSDLDVDKAGNVIAPPRFNIRLFNEADLRALRDMQGEVAALIRAEIAAGSKSPVRLVA